MKKFLKLSLFFAGVFVIVFLLWPSYHRVEAPDCGPFANCIGAEEPLIGGGVNFVGRLINGYTLNSSTGFHYFPLGTDSYFRSDQALLSAFIVSGLLVITFIIILRLKK